MGVQDNYESFPNNLFEPENIYVEGQNYRLYRARFNNLFVLYDYLKSNPSINRNIFREPASINGGSDFAGKPYPEAVEDLVGEIDPGYQEFLKLQRDFKNAEAGKIHKYKLVRTVAGGHLNVPAYCAGSPLCYETQEKITKPKFVSLHVSLSYYWGTSKQQVLHRAVIITNIIKALENAGYSVDLNTFELSSKNNELVYIVVQIKQHGGRLNMSALYKTLCHVEFLRRILFRILETMKVQCYWCDGYGSTCSEEFTREVLHLGKNDIFFDQPREMGITGDDLADDFESAIRHLNLEDKIDIEKAKKEFMKNTKILSKRR